MSDLWLPFHRLTLTYLLTENEIVTAESNNGEGVLGSGSKRFSSVNALVSSHINSPKAAMKDQSILTQHALSGQFNKHIY